MWKELCQTCLHIRTLLIDNEPKHSLGTQPPTGPVGQRPGRRPGEHVFFQVLDFFRQTESFQASLHTYLDPQSIMGDIHFWARNVLKFSALSNNPDGAHRDH